MSNILVHPIVWLGVSCQILVVTLPPPLLMQIVAAGYLDWIDGLILRNGCGFSIFVEGSELLKTVYNDYQFSCRAGSG